MAVPDVHADGAGGGLWFGVLGPVTVVADGEPVPIGGPGARGLLMLLLLHSNQVVPIERIIDELWGDEPPNTARTIVHGYVSRLRRALRSVDPYYTGARLVTRSPGYELRVEERRVDLFQVRRLLAAARGKPSARRAELLRTAAAMWRGQVPDCPPSKAAVAELTELRLVVTVERMEADLELGRHADLVGELRCLVRHHPFNETLVDQLIRALYGSGHRAEAVECYLHFQRRAVEWLGIDPGPRLRELHQLVLRDDPSLRAGGTGPDTGMSASSHAPAQGQAGEPFQR